MLYLIGLGLASEKDLSLKALDALKSCTHVFLENYTGVFKRVSELEALINKRVTILYRGDVEERREFLLHAKTAPTALLVQGDPLSATTHIEIILDCRKQGINYSIINSSSVFTAVARTGLFLYKFGKVASIPLPEKDFNPSSFYSILVDNQRIKAHTLFLLDLKPDKKLFMHVPQALKLLKSLDSKHYVNKVIVCARLGYDDELIKFGDIDSLISIDWGPPPYCIIVPSELHFMEEEFLKTF